VTVPADRQGLVQTAADAYMWRTVGEKAVAALAEAQRERAEREKHGQEETFARERAEKLVAERDYVIDLFQAAIRAHPRWCGYRSGSPGDSALNEALRAAEELPQKPCEHMEAWITNGMCQACFAVVRVPPEPEKRPPDEFWREVPCGHPRDPMAWQNPEGMFFCHCGLILSLAEALDCDMIDAPIPVVPCTKCGCHVGIPSVPPRGKVWGPERMRHDPA
jgi:hypothetical protein